MFHDVFPGPGQLRLILLTNKAEHFWELMVAMFSELTARQIHE